MQEKLRSKFPDSSPGSLDRYPVLAPARVPGSRAMTFLASRSIVLGGGDRVDMDAERVRRSESAIPA